MLEKNQTLKRLLGFLNNLQTLDRINFALLNQLSPVDRHCCITSKENFSARESDARWTASRINKVLEIYGTDWVGKRILELGGGYGDIGAVFADAGAEVLCAEGRVENFNIAKLKYRNLPRFKCILRDLEEDFTDLGKFDLIIHFGLLYHLKNVEQSLRNCAELSDDIVLDTVVMDSLDTQRVDLFTEEKDGWGLSIHGSASCPSPFYIKRVFEELGYEVDIITDKKLNAPTFIYDWEHKNDGTSVPGRRRFFWIRRKKKESLS